MTLEKAIEFGKIFLKSIENEKGSAIYEFVETAVKMMEKEPKAGHWIDDNKDEIDAQYGRHLYRCQICNKYADYFVGGTEDWWDVEKPNYCPNCGARMSEGSE